MHIRICVVKTTWCHQIKKINPSGSFYECTKFLHKICKKERNWCTKFFNISWQMVSCRLKWLMLCLPLLDICGCIHRGVVNRGPSVKWFCFVLFFSSERLDDRHDGRAESKCAHHRRSYLEWSSPKYPETCGFEAATTSTSPGTIWCLNLRSES